MVCFLASGALDQQGTCDHWSLLAGDLFMYLGLAQAVSGFFQPYVAVLDVIGPADAGSPVSLGAAYIAMLGFGGAAWLAATYVGPLISLLRSPFGRLPTRLLGVAYGLLLLALVYVGAETRRFEAASAGGDASAVTYVGEFLQPFRW
jgi:hypothetical protein